MVHGQNLKGKEKKKEKKGIQFDLKAFSNVILYKDVSNNNNNGILCFRLVLKNNFKDI